jgi:hypothetical protein
VTPGLRTLLIGTTIAMAIEAGGILLLLDDQMAAGIFLLAMGAVIYLVAIFRWRTQGR